MKTLTKCVLVCGLIFMTSCRDTAKEEAEAKATVEKIEALETEIDSISEDIDYKKEELDEALEELDSI